MPTVTALIQKTRRYVRDTPELDNITASVTSSATTISVADTSLYYKNEKIQLDQEGLLVRSIDTGTQLTVSRGYAGTIAATHASATTVLQNPSFLDIEYLDAANYALDLMYPYAYKEVEDTSLTGVTLQYDYDIPNETSTGKPIRALSRIEIKAVGGFSYGRLRGWRVNRGATPQISFFADPPPGATIRLHGYSNFPDLVFNGSTDTQFPDDLVDTLTLGMAEYLTASGEVGRVRTDTSNTDTRENANRTGSSLSVSNALLTRFERSLQRHAMAPLPKTIQRIF